MDATIKTRCAVIGGITVNSAMFAMVCALLSEAPLPVSTIAALSIAACVLAVAILWVWQSRPTLPAKPGIEATANIRSPQWFLLRLGLVVIGLGETFLPGILFIVLSDHCSAHGYLVWARFLDTGHVLCLGFLTALFFLTFNALLRQWLLVAANVLGPLIAFVVVAAIASAMGSIG